MSIGTLRLGSFLVVLQGVDVVGRERRYLEAGILSSSGGLVWRVCSEARAQAQLACENLEWA